MSMTFKRVKSATFFLDPFGCAKNQVDAEIIIARLKANGYEQTLVANEADFIIVNSCGFIESAKKESIDAVIAYKTHYPNKKIILSGCLAQRYATELSETLTEADAFFGNADPGRINEVLDRLEKTERTVLVPEHGTLEDGKIRGEFLNFPGSVYVKITEGCSNHCSFCAIPIIRGELRSREVKDVVDEIKELLARGIYEINLIGQDLGSFGMDTHAKQRLPELLTSLSALKGDFTVRVLYIHPDHFPLEILSLCKKDSRILPYFDIPFQHASDKILKAMNRKGKASDYLALIDTIRNKLDNAIIRSTFLVGFPGESDEDFELLLDFVKNARLDWAGAFVYSKEDGTLAFDLKGKVSKKTAEERKATLEKCQEAITQENLSRFVGEELTVLIEEHIQGEELSLGRIYAQAPEIDGLTVVQGKETLPGSTVLCKIIRVNGVDLEAMPVDLSE